MIEASASVVIEASVMIEVAAHPGKVLTRKAASESPSRARKMATAKPATHTSATESATHTSATETATHTSATEPAAHTSTTETAANMSAPESSAVSTTATVSSAATVSAATSAARERVSGQSPGESDSHSENDHGLP
jgi:hypothetical protein